MGPLKQLGFQEILLRVALSVPPSLSLSLSQSLTLSLSVNNRAPFVVDKAVQHIYDTTATKLQVHDKSNKTRNKSYDVRYVNIFCYSIR